MKIPTELVYLFPKGYLQAREDAKNTIAQCKKGKPCKTEGGRVVCIPKKATCASEKSNKTESTSEISVSKNLLIGLAAGSGVGALTALLVSQRNQEIGISKAELESAVNKARKEGANETTKAVENIKLTAENKIKEAENRANNAEAKSGKLESELSVITQDFQGIKSKHDAVKASLDEKSSSLIELQKQLVETTNSVKDKESLFVEQLDQAQSKLSESEKELAKAAKENEEAQKIILEKQKEIAAREKDRKTKLTRIQNLSTEVKKLSDASSKLESDLKESEKKLAEYGDENAQLKAGNASLSKEVSNRKVITAAIKGQRDEAHNLLTGKQKEIDGLTQQVTKAQEENNAAKKSLEDQKKYALGLRTQITKAEANHKSLAEDHQKAKVSLEQLRLKNQELESSNVESSKALENQKSYAAGLRTQIENVKAEREKYKSELAKTTDDLDAAKLFLKDKSDELAKEKELTQKLKSEHEELKSTFESRLSTEVQQETEKRGKAIAQRVKEIEDSITSQVEERVKDVQLKYEGKLSNQLGDLRREHDRELNIVKSKAVNEAAQKVDPPAKRGENVGDLILGSDNEIRLGASARKSSKANLISPWSSIGTESLPEEKAEKSIMARSSDVVEANFIPAYHKLSQRLRQELSDVSKMTQPELANTLAKMTNTKDMDIAIEKVAVDAPHLLTEMNEFSRAKMAAMESIIRSHEERERILTLGINTAKVNAREAYQEEFKKLQARAKDNGGTYTPEMLNDFDNASIKIARMIRAEAERRVNLLLGEESKKKKQDSDYWKEYYFALAAM